MLDFQNRLAVIFGGGRDIGGAASNSHATAAAAREERLWCLQGSAGFGDASFVNGANVDINSGILFS
jgi:hypothetical protein